MKRETNLPVKDSFFSDDGDSNDEGGNSRMSAQHSGGQSGQESTAADESNAGMKEVRDFISLETKRVRNMRVLVLTTICIIGFVVSLLTYFTMNNEQQRDIENSFIVFVNTIEDSFKLNVQYMLTASAALSKAITATAVSSGQVFPYVTVPAFEAKAFEARQKASFETILYAPVNNDLERWLDFSIENYDWVEESKEIFDALEPGMDRTKESPVSPPERVLYEFEHIGTNMALVPWNETGVEFAPIFYISPPPLPDKDAYMNVNWFSSTERKLLSMASGEMKNVVFSEFGGKPNAAVDDLLGLQTHINLHSEVHGREYESDVEIHSIAAEPVFSGLNFNEEEVVGFLYAIVAWDSYMVNLLPEGVNGIYVILQNTCGQAVTYELRGKEAYLIGKGDLHDWKYDGQVRTVTFRENYEDPDKLDTVEGHCQVFLTAYPTDSFYESNESSLPVIFTIIIAILFAMMALIFIVYDRYVQSRNQKVEGAAARSNAIVSSLFPSNVRDRLLAEEEKGHEKNARSRNLKSFLSSDGAGTELNANDGDIYKSKPIADLFPETTILFGDIVGFTAWSSVREPTQVFTLLETIYHAFDEIAKRRRVFKVETVGDCYVAVCGLPDPRKDHAVNMCRFARDCMFRMWALVKKLETTLGPDTGDLTMRMGLHSGPVTAGVLRGERSRFQLFGDTMNTAARMEQTGMRSKVQLSQETVDLLATSGKGAWFRQREDTVVAKGKGEMKTYWLLLANASDAASAAGTSPTADLSSSNNNDNHSPNLPEKSLDAQARDYTEEKRRKVCSDKTVRLIGWNVEVLLRLLKQIVARRNASVERSKSKELNEDLIKSAPGHLVLDEVKEIIELPEFDAETAQRQQEIEAIELDPCIQHQLEDFLMSIGAGYRDNPFHNFEHASHVTMSVVKLLSRIVAPSDIYTERTADASSLHDHTYGITSDPLTQFSCVLSALIHDLDHPGVPNTQLVKERVPLASYYKNQSIAEQNSVDIAFRLLMQPKYKELRSVIYSDETEMTRFRQLVVNSVMATDIVDKELKALRNLRWEKAFSESNKLDSERDQKNRKATIVIEHLIQASDVAHTMQHWHIYRKWNERFFTECYLAYKMGRAETDPSINWYKGEIGFFDFYIIPLAKKLKDCGVFGVSSDEYLNYAIKNRKEWEDKGQEVLDEMIEKVNRKWEAKQDSNTSAKLIHNTF